MNLQFVKIIIIIIIFEKCNKAKSNKMRYACNHKIKKSIKIVLAVRFLLEQQ